MLLTLALMLQPKPLTEVCANMSNYAVMVYRAKDQFSNQQEFEALLSKHLKFTQKIGVIGYTAESEQEAFEGAFSECMSVEKGDLE